MTETALKCKYCGKDMTSKRGVYAHETFHCPKRPAAGGGQASSDECKHSWKLLDSNDPVHARALAAGHKKYCSECLDVQ